MWKSVGGPERSYDLCHGISVKGFKILALAQGCFVRRSQETKLKALTPDGIAPPFARYSHGVEVPAGARLVRTSGQLGLSADGSVPEDVETQAKICFANITQILAEAGMSPAHVCHISAFVTDRAHMAGYMKVRDLFLADVTVLPTSTLMIVSGFTRPEFFVEVEVWAAVLFSRPIPDRSLRPVRVLWQLAQFNNAPNQRAPKEGACNAYNFKHRGAGRQTTEC